MSSIINNFKNIQNQLLVVVLGNISSISTGFLTGWIAPILRLLRSPQSPLPNGPITVVQQSWIGASEFFGIFFGPFLFLQIANRYGRKIAIIFVTIPTIIGTFLIIFGNSIEYFFAFRAICGLSMGATFLLIPLMVTEISDDHIRGTFGSILSIFLSSGLLIGAIIGSYIPFEYSKIFIFIFPVLLICSFAFIPESPVYLYGSNKDEIAEKSLKFYKNCAKNAEKLICEKAKVYQMLKKLNEGKNIQLTTEDVYNISAIKSLLAGIIIHLLNTFSGLVVIAVYASIIFQESGSTIDPNKSTMIMASIQVIGSIVAAILCDRIGRKVLLIVSLTGCAVGQFTMGLFSYYGSQGYETSSWSWTSIASMSLILFAASIGISPLRHVVCLEIVSPKLRPMAFIINNAFSCTSNFLIFKFFPTLANEYGLHTTMWALSTGCCIGVVFIAAVIRETKGRNVNT